MHTQKTHQQDNNISAMSLDCFLLLVIQNDLFSSLNNNYLKSEVMKISV